MWICPSCNGKNSDDEIRCICGKEFTVVTECSSNPWDDITLTTAPFLEGHVVEKTIEIVTAECAYGMNIFKDIMASVTDTFGGRSSSIQKTLRDARMICLKELRKEAYTLGANAVIAVTLDYNEFSGQGKSMLFLVASGTAVLVSQPQAGMLRQECASR